MLQYQYALGPSFVYVYIIFHKDASVILKGRVLRFSIHCWLLYYHLLVKMEATVWILLSVMITNGVVVAENSDATGIFN